MTDKVDKVGPVEVLSLAHVDSVEALRAANNKTLGFLPKGALAERLEAGDCLGVRDGGYDLIGYLLFAQAKDRLRVIHLCIAEVARRKGCAKVLVDGLRQEARQRNVSMVSLNCRRDYPAHRVWPKLGFIPLAEKPAKTHGRVLVHWVLEDRRKHDLFHVDVTEDRMNVVVDANVFFDLHAPDRPDTLVSKGLLADYLEDLLRMFITDETFVEIGRSQMPKQRIRSLGQAHAFPRVEHDAEQAAEYEHDLRSFLPSKTDSEISDIRQLAMAAASPVSIFVTGDERIRKASIAIQKAIGLRVIDPTQVIGELHRIVDRDSYAAATLSGSRLAWRRLSPEDLPRDKVITFLGPHERKSRFEALANEALARPDLWRIEGLWSDTDLVAIRALRLRPEDRLIEVALCRAARGSEQQLLTQFVAASILYEAVLQRYDTVRLRPHSIAPNAGPEVSEMGFVKEAGGYIRVCLTSVMPSKIVRGRLQQVVGHEASNGDVGAQCSPCALSDREERCVIVPIRPGYAQQIFDFNRAAEDIFEAERSVLLRWTNVYFRRKGQHRLLTAPARILWYVSGPRGGVVAVSRLDGVNAGSPKDMFREYRRMGALRWRDIYEMCRGEEVREIMVLSFSHTFMFNNAISLDELRELYTGHGKRLQVQSPSGVPYHVFLDVFRKGFPVLDAGA